MSGITISNPYGVSGLGATVRQVESRNYIKNIRITKISWVVIPIDPSLSDLDCNSDSRHEKKSRSNNGSYPYIHFHSS